MQGPRFGRYNSDELWSPDYGGIDWAMREKILVKAGELDENQSVGFDSGDGLVQEVTQENTVFRINRVDPDMDMVAESDSRDGKDYIWFRDQDPKRFEYLIRMLGHSSMIISTRFPLPDVVRIYLDRNTTGIDPQFLERPE